ncbi:hypothetical protein AB2M82_002783 [Raoultella planticola]
MCMSKPNVSAPPQVQAAPQVSDSAVQDAADSDRRRRAAAGGQKSTILTSSQGITQQATGTQGKTLLGA